MISVKCCELIYRCVIHLARSCLWDCCGCGVGLTREDSDKDPRAFPMWTFLLCTHNCTLKSFFGCTYIDDSFHHVSHLCLKTHEWTHYSQWKGESSKTYTQGVKKVSIRTWTPGRGLRWFAETPKPAAYMNMNRTGMGVSDHAGAPVCVERIILDELKLDEVAQRQTEIQRSSIKEKICDSVR